MPHTTYPFDVTNRAYQRFLALTSDHFEIVAWDDAATGRPTMITLINIGSRDAFSLALLDTVEDRRPHALLAVTTAAMSLHGPIASQAAAADYAPHLALRDPDVAATTPVALHDPDQPHISPDQWLTVPPDIAAAAPTTGPDAARVALVLLDRDRAQLTAVGPFDSIGAAEAWQPATDGWPPVDRLLLAIHTPVAQH